MNLQKREYMYLSALMNQVDIITNEYLDAFRKIPVMHIALANGQVCGAKRPRCGDSGRR